MFLPKSWKYKCKARPLVCSNRCCKGLLNDLGGKPPPRFLSSREGGRANLFRSAFVIKHFGSWILMNKYSRVDVVEIMIIYLMQYRSISFGEG